MDYHKEIDAATEISRQAGELALKYFGQKTETSEKPDLSPITIADRECERLIAGSLNDQFPKDGILGEEGAFRESQSGRRWIIDPIDGTRDFVRRTPFWATQIALQDTGSIVLGVIYLPVLRERVHAVANDGCYWNDSPVRASQISHLDKAVLCISGFKNVWDEWTAGQIQYLTQQCWTVRAFSGCYDVAMFARGKVDVWLSGNGMEWDYAPARVIAKESGAAFLTKDGSGRIDLRHCVICAPGLESEIRRLLAIPDEL